MTNTQICETCGKSYEGRGKRYCSKQCWYNSMPSNTINSGRREAYCVICGNRLAKHSKMVCSQTCDKVYRNIIKYAEGKSTEKVVKSLCKYYNGYKCMKCGISEWLGRPLSIELHHIDGDANNNTLSNVELLCPNCHAQTDNYKRKNKHSTRNRPT